MRRAAWSSWRVAEGGSVPPSAPRASPRRCDDRCHQRGRLGSFPGHSSETDDRLCCLQSPVCRRRKSPLGHFAEGPVCHHAVRDGRCDRAYINASRAILPRSPVANLIAKRCNLLEAAVCIWPTYRLGGSARRSKFLRVREFYG
jgi:hypothetical protein